MGWGSAIGAGAQIVGGLFGASQGRKAADANKKASQQSIAEWRAARDASIGYQQPYMDFGQGLGGLAGLNRLQGGDYSGFWNSPDFNASMEAGIYANDHSAAARGRLGSGGYAADLAKWSQNNAAGFLNNYRNSLFQGAGMGQQAANQAGSYQMNAAQGISNGLQGVANAANQRAGVNAGLGYGLAGLAGQYLPGMFNSSYGSTTAQAGSGGSGLGSGLLGGIGSMFP